jgi:hypothetical protein
MNCAACRHSEVTTAPDRAMIRVCVRNPPAVGWIATQQGVLTLTGFPRVDDSQRCGEFASAPPKLVS